MNNPHFVKIGLLPLAFLLIYNSSIAQKSPFQMRIGYEQLYVRPKTTNGIAEKTWTWVDLNGDELHSFRTSLTHAYQIGLSYDMTSWWSVNLDFKKFYRRYYVWSGTYLSEEWEGNAAGKFKIVPSVKNDLDFPSMFLGATLATTSWQLGTDFHHRISRSGKLRLHYYLSLNRDLYEESLPHFDTPVNYGVEGWYTDINTGKRVEYSAVGKLEFRSTNPHESQYRASTNIALALSKKLKRGMGLRLEFGLRNIRWIKNNLLDENHWEIDLNHQRFQPNESNPQVNDVIYDVSTNHEFPLYLGGYYSNLSFTFKPFRSPRDKDGYVPRGKRMKGKLKKIF